MGNFGTHRRNFLRSHTATTPSPTTTTDLVIMEFPAQDSPGTAECDPPKTPLTSERRLIGLPRLWPRRRRRTQGVQRPLQPRERIRWPGLQQPRLWRQGVQRQGLRLPQKPRGQPRQQRLPRHGVRRENVWRSAERKGVQPRLRPGPQLQQSGHPRQSREQRRARRTDEWSPGTRRETTIPLQLAE